MTPQIRDSGFFWTSAVHRRMIWGITLYPLSPAFLGHYGSLGISQGGNLPSMFEQTFKNIDDVLWKEAGCSSELDYTEQSSWLLFLKYLDDLEQDKSTEAALDGKKHTY